MKANADKIIKICHNKGHEYYLNVESNYFSLLFRCFTCGKKLGKYKGRLYIDRELEKMCLSLTNAHWKFT